MEKKLRIEIRLTDADEDIIEFLSKSDVPRATQFKNAMRAYMNRKEEEQFDTRVKRLLSEVIAESELGRHTVEVKPKKKLGFSAKKG